MLPALLFVVTSISGHGHAADPVVEWNRIALATMSRARPPQGPVLELRTLTIVHVAIHDAFNAVTGRYRPYLPAGPVSRGASPEAAVIAAAHHTLSRLFPAERAALEAARAASLAGHETSESDPGVQVGEAAASAVLRRASQDGFAQASGPYSALNAGQPGAWVPVDAAPVVLPALGKVTPWVLRSAAEFRPGPPPPLDGATYARDYNEVKAMGSSMSVTRTAGQTAIAKFWLASPAQIWTEVARQVLAARGADSSTAARVFALMYLAASDASIACWDAKYSYRFWRPITAIRRGELDGNAATSPDPSWEPLDETHQHPEYPSGHATNSAAMAGILSAIFGDDPGVRVVVTSPTSPGLQRTWTTFKAARDEVIDARVYAGFHFRTSDEVGAQLGDRVARYVFENALQKRH